MGLLINGIWTDEQHTGELHAGGGFRNFIAPDSAFPPQANRYRIFASYACPWAHRTLIMRVLKNLQNTIALTIVNPEMSNQGWDFAAHPNPQVKHDGDPIIKADYLHQIYTLADAQYNGRVSVPVLFDEQQKTIVSNESADIIRMLNNAFDDTPDTPDANDKDYYPPDKQKQIDRFNDLIMNVNIGVYQCGFAEAQADYDVAYETLFETLEQLEAHLQDKRFILGEELTECDIRLFPSLLRFDAVYHGLFKCNKFLIRQKPNLSRYLKEIYEYENVKDTIDMLHVRIGYYAGMPQFNPFKIVPPPLQPEIP